MERVIIADNQDITRIGMETLISAKKGAPIILYAGQKHDLIKLLISYPESLIILDYTLFDLERIEDLLNLGLRFPLSHWLLFSDELSNDFLRRIVYGYSQYSILLKSCELDEINIGLAHTLKGERFVCSRVANMMLQPSSRPSESLDRILTNTEREILKEIALGKTTKEIAANRNLSFHTVITHRKNIFRKLEVNNVHEAIKYAMRAGLVDLAEYYI
ncbi:MAG: response regulator transcription factor [Prevotella sp.]|nr:response regulator transcription factor [Prevotella sp.]